MKTLTVSTGAFDYAALFVAEVTVRGKSRRITCYIGDNEDGSLYINKHPVCISSNYSEEESASIDRLNRAEPVRDGEIVEVKGVKYKVVLVGDYLDAGKLVPGSM